MDKSMFEELLASVHEIDEIVKGQKEPAKVTEFPKPEVKAMVKPG